MQQLFFFLTIITLFSCGVSSAVKQNYTFEDKQVFDLVDRLKKNPNDEAAQNLLPEAYRAALQKRDSLTEEKYYNLGGGDRHIALANEWRVMQQMYEAILSTPAAKKALPNPWDPSFKIQQEYNHAADEYYEQGLTYLNYDTRPNAQKAYEYFSKANKAVPGYKDVKDLMAEALDKSYIKVIVNPVNYYNNGFGFWGFQNDWFQQQMVRDLNFRSYKDVKFFTDWEARSRSIKPDKIVDLNFTRIYISQLFNQTYTINRTKQVQTGETKSNPPKPIYQNVIATVYVTKRYMQSNATLQCRIYDVYSNRNSFYDNFSNSYNWNIETATYRGDSRALTAEDLRLINNSFTNAPGREEIADRLLRDSYSMLLSRINNRVSF
jgi:tetratricopeptide (TPR) repeat protein